MERMTTDDLVDALANTGSAEVRRANGQKVTVAINEHGCFQVFGLDLATSEQTQSTEHELLDQLVDRELNGQMFFA